MSVTPLPVPQLSPLPAVREAHLQIRSPVRTAARRQEDGRPARRRRGVQDQPLREGGGGQAGEYAATLSDWSNVYPGMAKSF